MHRVNGIYTHYVAIEITAAAQPPPVFQPQLQVESESI